MIHQKYSLSIIIFSLVLLSPLPFISPFESVMQDAAAQSQFSSFDVDPTSSTVQPLAGFALVSEIFETEPTDRYRLFLLFTLCLYLNIMTQYMH